jgi:hypothetical protein
MSKRRAPTTGFNLRRPAPGGDPRGEKKASYAGGMKKPIPAPIESLFQRYPALAGFSVRGLRDVPDSCSRTGDESELFVSDIGVLPSLSDDQYGEIFQEIATTLADLLAEYPDAGELLRGRTFARTLH